MRIVGGRLGGRRFDGPDGEGTRPTSERAREAISSALTARGLLRDARVLDLFAGTGALGFEALSRGAVSLACVEQDPKVARALVASAKKLGIADVTDVLTVDAFSAKLPRALTPRVFDLVFTDPPYALAARVPALLDGLFDAGVLGPETVVVFEHGEGAGPGDGERFATFARYSYGAAQVRFLGARDVKEAQ